MAVDIGPAQFVDNVRTYLHPARADDYTSLNLDMDAPENVALVPQPHSLRPDVLVCASVLSNNSALVGSPNTHLPPPCPQISKTCTLVLREDVRFHVDDPIEWPQWFCSEEPHLACILRPQRGSTLAALWSSGTPDEWEDEEMGYGIGRYNPRFLDNLKTAFETTFANHSSNVRFCDGTALDKNAPLLSNALATSGTAKLISQLHTIATVGFDLLSSTRLPFLDSYFTLRILQRICLEYTALVTYERQYKHFIRFEVGLDANHSDPAEDKYMGCYSNDIKVVSALIAARLPVWSVQSLLGAKIQVVALAPPASFTHLEAMSHWRSRSRGVLFEGPHTTGAKYRRIRDYLLVQMGQFHTPALESLPARPPTLPPLPSTSISRTTAAHSRSRQRKEPYSSRNKRLILPVHSYLPLPPPIWRTTYESIDADEGRCLDKSSRPNPGYFLPRPDLFTSSTSENGIKMMRSWLKLRPFVLLAYSTPTDVPITEHPRLGHQAWRQWLNETAADPTPNQPGSSSKIDNRKVNIQTAARDFVNSIQKGNTTIQPSVPSAPPRWHGSVFDPQDVTAWREILWELTFMSFRLELQDLDSRLTRWAQGPKHHRMMLDVFRMRGTSLLRCDLGMANIGLMDGDWRYRGRSVWALQELMNAWDVEKPEVITNGPPKTGFDVSSFADFEKGVVSFYIDTYWRIFGRAPILPTQLSHVPSPDRCSWVAPDL